jgi:hypothetical protein
MRLQLAVPQLCVQSHPAGVSLDIQFEVSVVPGPPAAWSVAIVERYRNTTAAAAAARQQDGDSLNLIPCGKHFTLEIEALDVNHNRWAAS